jgi:hypothetical protein
MNYGGEGDGLPGSPELEPVMHFRASSNRHKELDRTPLGRIAIVTVFPGRCLARPKTDHLLSRMPPPRWAEGSPGLWPSGIRRAKVHHRL